MLKNLLLGLQITFFVGLPVFIGWNIYNTIIISKKKQQVLHRKEEATQMLNRLENPKIWEVLTYYRDLNSSIDPGEITLDETGEEAIAVEEDGDNTAVEEEVPGPIDFHGAQTLLVYDPQVFTEDEADRFANEFSRFVAQKYPTHYAISDIKARRYSMDQIRFGNFRGQNFVLYLFKNKTSPSGYSAFLYDKLTGFDIYKNVPVSKVDASTNRIDLDFFTPMINYLTTYRREFQQLREAAKKIVVE